MNINQAIAEAGRCLLCHDAPCSAACPGGTDPARFIRKLRLSNVTGAIRTIKVNNVLGGVCGLLCPSQSLCEGVCLAKGLDRPIRIAEIQAALVRHSWDIGFNVFEGVTPSKAKVAVVGAGPAGLTCAAWLAREGYQVTVFEERCEAGGVLRYGVPAHRLPPDVLNREFEDLKILGVKFKFKAPIKGEEAIRRLYEDGFKAICLAIGLWQSVRLNKTRGRIEGVYDAVEFLEAARTEDVKFISSLVKGKTVAVIGGGSVAIDCSETAKILGAADVYTIYRRSYQEMPAEEVERTRALGQGIHFLVLNQPDDYVVEGGKLNGLRLVRTRLGEMDSSKRRTPEKLAGSEWVLPVDVCIEAIGAEAHDELPRWYPGVGFSPSRLIESDPNTCETRVGGIFAGGDIVRGPALIIDAVADGKKAAKAIIKYLSE